jgi:uncharacterized protein (DUF427 family)
MARATWNGAVLAESDSVEVVEGNVYFPPDAVRSEYLQPTDTHTVCWWKGTASYYPETSEKARTIEGFVAFWKGVTVER